MKKLTAFLSALALGLTVAPMAAFAETENGQSSAEIQVGDVNADGRVDGVDATLTLRYYTLMISDVNPADIPYSDTIVEYGDMDGNGVVDGVDAAKILRQYTLNSSKTEEEILKEAQDVIDQMREND
ncbi:MAG: dockerin type I domain-containing protein [Ruminococcus flavefaciens]|nr:dockerin type I domain-containing protein [Ruminococcus flavefaciens]MCM1061445.1 dockerin type I domain-containing protein [Eubacterium sp.]